MDKLKRNIVSIVLILLLVFIMFFSDSEKRTVLSCVLSFILGATLSIFVINDIFMKGKVTTRQKGTLYIKNEPVSFVIISIVFIIGYIGCAVALWHGFD